MLKAEDFIKEHPTKFSSLILISNFFANSDNPKALERVLGYMQGEVMKTQLAARLRSYSEKVKRSAEGAPMPYFKLTDKEDKEIYSHDFGENICFCRLSQQRELNRVRRCHC